VTSITRVGAHGHSNFAWVQEKINMAEKSNVLLPDFKIRGSIPIPVVRR